ncbi:EAL domain-containing protein [Burkholderiaceae bacterium DAT-1]|nr:EAL domain-containing protein [Burkholderiaceae bacterium DAT-1]
MTSKNLQRAVPHGEHAVLGPAPDYLELLDATSAVLLEPGSESLSRALCAVATAFQAATASLYRSRSAGTRAERLSVWRTSELHDLEVQELKWVDYARYPDLHDALSAGLIVTRSRHELPSDLAEFVDHVRGEQLTCVPLLDDGDLIGFLALIHFDRMRQRHKSEGRLMSNLANYLSLALVKQENQERLHSNEIRLKALVGATEDIVFELDQTGLIINVWSVHPALPPGARPGNALSECLPDATVVAIMEAGKRVFEGAGPVQMRFALESSGKKAHFICRLERIPSAEGGESHLIVLARDATEWLHEDARRRVMVETLNLLEEAIVDLSPDGTLVHASAAWTTLRSAGAETPESDVGRNLLEFVHEDERDLLKRSLLGVADGRPLVVQRFRLLRGDAEPLWLEARLIASVDVNGQIISLRGVLRDVTVAHLHERHIMRLALYDGLTGLPNRMLLDDVLHQSLTRAKRNGTRVALGFIDLDHFKQINDAFGHHAGDRALITVAGQLKSVLREEDILARWGGDEFVVLIPDIDDTDVLMQIAERLREIARKGVMIDGLEMRPTISIGMAIYPDNADTGEALMTAADSTMYHAKASGRNNVQFFSDVLNLKTMGREHMAIQTRLNRAVQENELRVFYQPIINARTGKVSSVEALVRWHDVSGWITPQVFIPMAEKLGLIQELSEQVTVQAIAMLRQWRDRGFTQRLALNVSRNLLFSPHFVRNLIDQVTENGLVPGDIIIEVTESLALTDYARQTRHLSLLHDAGFLIAIDDFGTGYSSLSQLHDMPIDMLKVDLSFTSRLNTEAGRRIMQAIVQMGHALGLEVVVEGVESQVDVAFLQGLGVEKMQGFHFSEPVAASMCELFLELGAEAVAI